MASSAINIQQHGATKQHLSGLFTTHWIRHMHHQKIAWDFTLPKVFHMSNKTLSENLTLVILPTLKLSLISQWCFYFNKTVAQPAPDPTYPHEQNSPSRNTLRNSCFKPWLASQPAPTRWQENYRIQWDKRSKDLENQMEGKTPFGYAKLQMQVPWKVWLQATL